MWLRDGTSPLQKSVSKTPAIGMSCLVMASTVLAFVFWHDSIAAGMLP